MCTAYIYRSGVSKQNLFMLAGNKFRKRITTLGHEKFAHVRKEITIKIKNSLESNFDGL